MSNNCCAKDAIKRDNDQFNELINCPISQQIKTMMRINAANVDKNFHSLLMHHEAVKLLKNRPKMIIVKNKDGLERKKVIDETENN